MPSGSSPGFVSIFFPSPLFSLSHFTRRNARSITRPYPRPPSTSPPHTLILTHLDDLGDETFKSDAHQFLGFVAQQHHPLRGIFPRHVGRIQHDMIDESMRHHTAMVSTSIRPRLGFQHPRPRHRHAPQISFRSYTRPRVPPCPCRDHNRTTITGTRTGLLLLLLLPHPRLHHHARYVSGGPHGRRGARVPHVGQHLHQTLPRGDQGGPRSARDRGRRSRSRTRTSTRNRRRGHVEERLSVKSDEDPHIFGSK